MNTPTFYDSLTLIIKQNKLVRGLIIGQPENPLMKNV